MFMGRNQSPIAADGINDGPIFLMIRNPLHSRVEKMSGSRLRLPDRTEVMSSLDSLVEMIRSR